MEPSRRRARPASFVAVLVLLVLAATTLGSFVHTDDGCAVERHCRACRVALASAGAATPDVPQLAVSGAALVIGGEAPAALRDVPVACDPSRGPPSAL